jgi:HSP20 family protein
VGQGDTDRRASADVPAPADFIGVYRSKRSYGTFCRTIPLPEGTPTDQAKATFKNGVLKIRVPAARGLEGRPLEIAG